jgi:hypothetical protein
MFIGHMKTGLSTSLFRGYSKDGLLEVFGVGAEPKGTELHIQKEPRQRRSQLFQRGFLSLEGGYASRSENVGTNHNTHAT